VTGEHKSYPLPKVVVSEAVPPGEVLLVSGARVLPPVQNKDGNPPALELRDGQLVSRFRVAFDDAAKLVTGGGGK